MTHWTTLLRSSGDRIELRPPATPEAQARAATALGYALPPDLADLLAETDGFYDQSAQYEACWSLERIVSENTRLRSEAVLPNADLLLCFGDNGAGEPFLHRRDTDGRWMPQIHVWNWIDQEARQLAPSLADFWDGWLSGTITT